MFLKNHPNNSALLGAGQNTPYAELGIMGTSIAKKQPRPVMAGGFSLKEEQVELAPVNSFLSKNSV
jgi:hypothetical protein